MKNLVHLSLLAVFLIGLNSVNAIAAESATPEDQLKNDFQKPPAEARPWVYWFWINDNLTREGITADLESMARVGIGGVLIFEVDLNTPKGNADFAGPVWMDLFNHACKEAKRLGLEINMSNDAGWCGSGGPWITPELSMQKVVWSETVMDGGKSFAGVLPKPQTKTDFYRDIAVLAYPSVFGDDVRMADLNPKITTNGKPGKPGSYVFERPFPTDSPSIQFDFNEPFEASRLTGYSVAPFKGVVQASDDGREFRQVAAISHSSGTFLFRFERPAKARFFRVLITEPAATVAKYIINDLELCAGYRVEDFLDKAAFSMPRKRSAKSAWEDVPSDRVIKGAAITDVSEHMDATGNFTWNPPPGKWTVIRFGHTTTGKGNHPAPVSGVGLECDKLSKEAAQVMFNGLIARLVDANKELSGQGNTFVSTHIDSWETGSQNWTPKMRAEFRRLRGYDPLKYLPLFTGRVVDSLEASERFLWDLRQTVSDLLVENYAGEFRRLANQKGLRLSIESYLAPAADLPYAAQADEPMAEFWAMERYGMGPTCLEMASAAHMYGKKIVGAESFTSRQTERWQCYPGNIKDLGDQALCDGINRIVFHRFAQQPWVNPVRAPGMSMGGYGLEYERTQTWWEMTRPWHEYLARCQQLLRQGLFVADILLLADGKIGRADGYKWDQCSPEALADRVNVKDGCLVCPDGMSYRVLVLPEGETMPLRLLRRIKELADQGATIIGPVKPPLKSPSLADMGAGDAEVKKLVAELWGGGKIVTGKTVVQLLSERGVKPDFSAKPPLNFIHRRTADADIYFVANPQNNEVTTTGEFRITGRQPELWHPETGAIRDLPDFNVVDGVTRIPLRLGPAEAMFVVFRERSEKSVARRQNGGKNWLDLKPVQEIAGPWQVQFDPKWGGPEKPVTFTDLCDWSKQTDPAIQYYSGVATYRKTFTFSSPVPGQRNYLDLGKVAVMAEVKLNGKVLGIAWKAPYRVDATAAITPGENTLEIKVANLWINRMIGDEQLPEDSERGPTGTLKNMNAWPQWITEGKPSPTGRFTFTTHRHWKKDESLAPSGLLGPVRVMVAE